MLAVPLVTYHMGNPGILANVNIVSIFYGWDAASDPALAGIPVGNITAFENRLDTYLSDLSGSSYLGNLAEYGVGPGSLIPANPNNNPPLFDAVPFPQAANITPAQQLVVPSSVFGPKTYPANKQINNVIADRNGNGINDPNNIQAMITGEIGKKNVPNPVQGTTLYWVWTPPGINVFFQDASGGPNTPMSNYTFGGYHFFTNGANQFAYAVMPYPSTVAQPAQAGFNPSFNLLTGLGGHEMGEAVTDPYGTGWYYLNTGGEIGDLLDGQNVWFTPMQAGASGNTYYVQLLWSNFIALSTYPHDEPLVGGNPKLPGNVNSPNSPATRPPTNYQPNPPGPNPPPRPPTQPARPPLPVPPSPPPPPTHTGPSVPGGGAVVQPVIVSSRANPNDLAVGSQNGVVISTNGGGTWSSPVPCRPPSAATPAWSTTRMATSTGRTSTRPPAASPWRCSTPAPAPSSAGRTRSTPPRRGPPTSSSTWPPTTPRQLDQQ